MINYARSMTQVATYWPPVAVDRHGKVITGAPVPVRCRWEDKGELFIDANGNQAMSSAVIYPAKPLSIQGYLLNGTSKDAVPGNGAREIKQTGSSPSLDGSQVLNKVWL